ncbi:transmembrane protein 246 [Etheostoma cragini]|uniref:transmembrane protein 246 n=1 Tax=Etheostoma cragini TaxID=417921 RepID=UPI00155F03A9|nr:transmembrane protein 246 [Etheostoma cragini]
MLLLLVTPPNLATSAMPRCRASLSQSLRWSNPAVRAAALCAVTFGVVLPLCCHRMLYSYFFLRSAYLDSMSEAALQRSLDRGRGALLFWQSATAAAARVGDAARRPDLLVTVVTSSRSEGRDFHYLLQVTRQLSGILDSCGARRCAEVLVCDVESGHLENQDAKLLEAHFSKVCKNPGGLMIHPVQMEPLQTVGVSQRTEPTPAEMQEKPDPETTHDAQNLQVTRASAQHIKNMVWSSHPKLARRRVAPV